MPRGVPKAGFRVSKNRIQQGWQPPEYHKGVCVAPAKNPSNIHYLNPKAASVETDDEIAARIRERFSILKEMAEATVKGHNAAMIVSGPAGCGKTFTVEDVLKRSDRTGKRYTVVKGYVRAPGLLKLLFQHKDEGKVLVFDDADTIFHDETSLNLLKAVCDSSEKRRVDYRVESTIVDDETGLPVPKSFDFDGSIIFISNLDFEGMIASGNKLAPHLQALVSRSYYVDCAMKTRKDILVRLNEVVKEGMLSHLSSQAQTETMEFIRQHQEALRELSLRSVMKVANIRQMNNPRWQALARITLCRNS